MFRQKNQFSFLLVSFRVFRGQKKEKTQSRNMLKIYLPTKHTKRRENFKDEDAFPVGGQTAFAQFDSRRSVAAAKAYSKRCSRHIASTESSQKNLKDVLHANGNRHKRLNSSSLKSTHARAPSKHLRDVSRTVCRFVCSWFWRARRCC